MPQGTNVDDILSIPEMEERARSAMARMAYEFVASGAGDENTVKWNREAYDRIALRPRVLRNVAVVDTSVTLFGRSRPFPILLAPTAYHRALNSDGEVATAKGAGTAGATWIVSSATTTSIEDIARVATGPLWFQLYIQSDRDFTREVVRRAEDAGVEVLVLTVDTPTLGARNRQTRSNFRLPLGASTPHLFDVGKGRQEIMDPRRSVITWADVEWLKSITRLPLVLKGILTPEDAEASLDAGADGLIVSNHAGRNLDTLPASIEALPAVADACAGRVPVLMDGGIRRGTDVIKALAYGAGAVLIGRPYCYGLGLAGAKGVQRVVEILRDELAMAMMLTGRASLSEVDRSIIW